MSFFTPSGDVNRIRPRSAIDNVISSSPKRPREAMFVSYPGPTPTTTNNKTLYEKIVKSIKDEIQIVVQESAYKPVEPHSNQIPVRFQTYLTYPLFGEGKTATILNAVKEGIIKYKFTDIWIQPSDLVSVLYSKEPRTGIYATILEKDFLIYLLKKMDRSKYDYNTSSNGFNIPISSNRKDILMAKLQPPTQTNDHAIMNIRYNLSVAPIPKYPSIPLVSLYVPKLKKNATEKSLNIPLIDPRETEVYTINETSVWASEYLVPIMSTIEKHKRTGQWIRLADLINLIYIDENSDFANISKEKMKTQLETQTKNARFISQKKKIYRDPVSENMEGVLLLQKQKQIQNFKYYYYLRYNGPLVDPQDTMVYGIQTRKEWVEKYEIPIMSAIRKYNMIGQWITIRTFIDFLYEDEERAPIFSDLSKETMKKQLYWQVKDARYRVQTKHIYYDPISENARGILLVQKQIAARMINIVEPTHKIQPGYYYFLRYNGPLDTNSLIEKNIGPLRYVGPPLPEDPIEEYVLNPSTTNYLHPEVINEKAVFDTAPYEIGTFDIETEATLRISNIPKPMPPVAIPKRFRRQNLVLSPRHGKLDPVQDIDPYDINFFKK
jgi:hypothetical protein